MASLLWNDDGKTRCLDVELNPDVGSPLDSLTKGLEESTPSNGIVYICFGGAEG